MMYNAMYRRLRLPSMIRKQIYVAVRHEQLLKRLARLRNVSEAELIREAIDRQVEGASAAPLALDPAAWDEARRFMSRLRRPAGARPRRVRREEAYEGRLRRWR
jgi:hypothetical protein